MRMKKRPIADVLRAMEIGDVEKFPLEQHNSINNAKNSSLLLDRANGKNWKVSRDLKEGVSVVTRIA